MYKAQIFQKNIATKSSESDFIERFNNCLVEIDEEKLIIQNDKQVNLIETKLQLKERDFHTVTYHGNFKDGWSTFRVIRPIDIALENIKQEFNCQSAFSIASISPTGYAIHFLLLSKDEIRDLNIVEKGKNEQIEKLLEGCIISLENQLYENFIDYTKRILGLVNHCRELLQFKFGSQIIQIMREVQNVYSEEEKRKLS